jgi:hypothetical protein
MEWGGLANNPERHLRPWSRAAERNTAEHGFGGSARIGSVQIRSIRAIRVPLTAATQVANGRVICQAQAQTEGGLAPVYVTTLRQVLFLLAAGCWLAGPSGPTAAQPAPNADARAGKLVLVAGNGKGGDGGPATNARLATPYGVSFDGQGNIYLGEIYGHRVRKIDLQGTITTVAGTGEKGYGRDGVPGGEVPRDS